MFDFIITASRGQFLTKIPLHTWGNGCLRKPPREAGYAALSSSVRRALQRQRSTLKSRHENWGRVNLWGFFEFVKFLFAKTYPDSNFSRSILRYCWLHFVSTAKCGCKRGTWEGGGVPEHRKKIVTNTASTQEKPTEHRHRNNYF